MNKKTAAAAAVTAVHFSFSPSLHFTFLLSFFFLSSFNTRSPLAARLLFQENSNSIIENTCHAAVTKERASQLYSFQYLYLFITLRPTHLRTKSVIYFNILHISFSCLHLHISAVFLIHFMATFVCNFNQNKCAKQFI